MRDRSSTHLPFSVLHAKEVDRNALVCQDQIRAPQCGMLHLSPAVHQLPMPLASCRAFSSRMRCAQSPDKDIASATAEAPCGLYPSFYVKQGKPNFHHVR
jgi:hypothetical protein